MAGKIKGIVIEIGADTKPLEKALDGVNKKSKDIQAELRQVDRLLKLDPKNTTLVEQKQKLLAEAVSNTSDKLETLKDAERQVQAQFAKGEIGEDQYRALQREIISTEQNLESLEKQAKQSNSAIKGFADAGDKLTSIGKKMSVVSAGIAAGVGAAANSALESADNLIKLADQTGLTTTELQELQYVGGQVGVELDTIAGAQAKLTKAMSGARDGTGAQADAFKTLGISVTDANGQLRNAQDVMGETLNKLNGIENETERDALSMAIFGKSAMELNPLMKLGADGIAEMKQNAHDMGIVMDEETIASLDNFGDSMEGLKSVSISAIGEALTPFIEKLTDMVNWFANLDGGTKSAILTILAIVAALGPLLMIIGSISTGISVLIPIVGGVIAAFSAGGVAAGVLGTAFTVLTGPIGLAIAFIAALIAMGVKLYKNWDAVKEYADSLKEKLKNMFDFKWNLPKIKLPHFNIQGQFSLNPPSIPSFGVDWYKTGGVFTKPSVIGVGEGGEPEGVFPLSYLKGLLGSGEGGASTVNHTGTIRVEGVSNEGQLIAVKNIIVDEVVRDNRRMPNRPSLY
ncbi:MAG: hypothetical protein K0R54_2229 [Clostridiaceae bacterium]|jgi:phage-related minor tail protein|nr:hypothetical protein [Clostridiaceae bacterium]